MKGRSIEMTGKTTEEAIKLALEKLGITENEAKIEILEEAKSGFMGFIGSRPARVKVEVKVDKAEMAEKLLESIFKGMGVVCSIERSEKKGKIVFDVDGQNVATLIGKRGATLEAIQHIVNTVVNKDRGNGERVEVEIDISGYRNSRKTSLEELAERLAKKVAQSHRSIELEPMSANERKIIHMVLKEHPKVYTYSKGEEPYRKVVISSKEKGMKKGAGEGAEENTGRDDRVEGGSQARSDGQVRPRKRRPGYRHSGKHGRGRDVRAGTSKAESTGGEQPGGGEDHSTGEGSGKETANELRNQGKRHRSGRRPGRGWRSRVSQKESGEEKPGIKEEELEKISGEEIDSTSVSQNEENQNEEKEK